MVGGGIAFQFFTWIEENMKTISKLILFILFLLLTSCGIEPSSDSVSNLFKEDLTWNQSKWNESKWK